MSKWLGFFKKVRPVFFIVAFILLPVLYINTVSIHLNKNANDLNMQVGSSIDDKEGNNVTNEEELWMQDQIKKMDETEKKMKESVSRKNQSSDKVQSQDEPQIGIQTGG